MSVKKSAVKQYLKYILQKTVLPLSYGINRRKPIDERLVLFADSNCDTPPDSMTALMDELTRRGYVCEPQCLDFSRSGFVGMLKFMLRFMKRYASARALVVCNYFVPMHACDKRSETKVVQLWHSCGALKKFGYSSPSDISPHFKGSVSKNVDLVTVSSPECEAVFKEAFRLPDGVARAVGISRTDVFFDESYADECRKKLYGKYPQVRGKKLLLYMPTFRGDASHARSEGHEEVLALKDTLGEEWYVAVRMHPRIKDGITDLADCSTNELLPCADMLITDYSSVIFEYALFGKPMVLWCPDLEEYLSERDFYLDFRRDIPCPVVTDGGRLAETVTAELESFESGKYRAFTEKYMSACDGKSTERIADFIEVK
jgi:CDP-ribitol ribitolphosphotransferase